MAAVVVIAAGLLAGMAYLLVDSMSGWVPVGETEQGGYSLPMLALWTALGACAAAVAIFA
jgi:hypothetical protein